VTSGRSGRHRPRHLRHPPLASRLHDNRPDVTVDAGALQEQYGSSASGHSGEVRCAAPAGPPPVGPQDRVQCPGEGGQVSVVDAAVIQLTGELAEQPRPASTGRLEGYTISTRRSTTCTAARPEFAAWLCSQARCRQVAEHHFGIGPRLRGVIGPPHHPQVFAAMRRSRPYAAGPARSGRGRLAAVCCWRWRRCCSPARRRARYSGVPLVPMASVCWPSSCNPSPRVPSPTCKTCVRQIVDLLHLSVVLRTFCCSRVRPAVGLVGKPSQGAGLPAVRRSLGTMRQSGQRVLER
jgi:hypothetical protein